MLISYQYNSNGNTISKDANGVIANYSYDYQNRLTQVDDGVDVVQYAYDTDGMRVQKIVNGDVTNFLLDKNRDYAQVMQEYNDPDFVLVSYIYGDDLIAQNRNSSLSYYHYDGQLSTRQLTDRSTIVTDTYTYDAFGLLLQRSGSTENDYLYTGEQYDPNVGFYYLRARYYDPSIGRFHAMDTWPGMQFEPLSLHKYLYCESGPVGRWDPSGHWTSTTLMVVTVAIYTAMIGMTASISYAFVSHLINRAITPVEWTGKWESYAAGIYAGIRIKFASFSGKHETESGILRGDGKYIIFFAGITLGPIPAEYHEAESVTLFTPGPYSANPLVLCGTAGYMSFAIPFAQDCSTIDFNNISATSIFMGMGMPFNPRDLVGSNRGVDIGSEIYGGLSIKTGGNGPY